MFLATTADERYWKTDEKILFLGEWCKRYDRKDYWSRLDHETLPYHWDNRQRLYRDFQYLAQVYEHQLARLAEQLDRLHGEAHSVRYWRIIIGPWLRYFIEAAYDRFLSIESAIQCGRVTGTWISNASAAGWTPRDFPSFVRWYISDEYNHYLYGRIIAFLGGILCQQAATPASSPETERVAGSFLRSAVKSVISWVPSSLNRIVFVSSYFGYRDLAALQISLRQLPYLVTPNVAAGTEPPDFQRRQALIDRACGTPFEQLLAQLVPDQLPIVYIEGYRGMRRRALGAFPCNPQLIFTAGAYSEDEGFKFWAAHQCERGAKLCVGQHGGHNGMGRWSSCEDHEIKISDRYYTWGWSAAADSAVTVPLSGGPLVRARRALKASRAGGILWAVMSLPRFSYWMYSVPVGPQMLGYFDDQQRFAKAACPEARELLRLRLYPHDFGWDQAGRWRDADPRLTICGKDEPFIDQLNQSRLFVGTYNSTTYLETFVADYPTVIFWNPAHWELRGSVQSAFDDLRDAGILHDSPESAAAKVNEIYRDPQRWWREPRVQEAKGRFCARFARVREDWLQEWKTELSQLAGT